MPERVHRSQLKNASYNPRSIDAYTRKKLEGVLRKKGLLSTIVWNRTTQNIVGGHQRIDAIDAIEGSADYLLDVSVVEMSPKEEREANLMLNNSGLTGDWDFAKLAEMSQQHRFVASAVSEPSPDRGPQYCHQ